MLGKLLLSAFISLSLRTANVPDKPTDYEYKGGYKTKTISVSGYRERENGIVYNGFNYKRNDKIFYSSIIYKEAYNIDSQTFVIKMPVKNWSFGTGLNSQRWNYGRIIFMLQYNDGIIDLSYQLAENRQIINSKISQEISLKRGFFIEPLALYHYEIVDNYRTDFWQAKINLIYKFNIKDN